MARIRTIKPEFWVSEPVMSCSIPARLLWIGMWSFADDGGVHPAQPKRLRAEVYPGDECTAMDVSAWVDELIGAGLIEAYEVNGKPYWRIIGWHEHQRIDRPTYQHPQPDGDVPTAKPRRAHEPASTARGIGDPSPTARGRVDDMSTTPRAGREGKGKEGNGVEKPSREGARERGAADAGGNPNRRHRSPKWSQHPDAAVCRAAALLGVATRGVSNDLLYRALAAQFRAAAPHEQSAVWAVLEPVAEGST